ncbi:hypothetical protein M3Y97_00783600 [Aphelenchoides bicaudatus]|nr:hypothetical protein M3Y97_00783600 [Aphelenchoides bicaudatus]
MSAEHMLQMTYRPSAKTHKTNQESRTAKMPSTKVHSSLPRFQMPFSFVSFAKYALILVLLINFPLSSHAASFYFGTANENSLDTSFKNIESADKLDQEEMRNIYTFCNVLPLLEKSGRMPKNKNANVVCDKLMVLLEPMFGDKKLPVKRRRNNNTRLLFNSRMQRKRL